jgi:hypothetical protein
LNSCVRALRRTYRPAGPAVRGVEDANTMGNAMLPAPTRACSVARPDAFMASPCGHGLVAIRTLPRGEPRRLGRTSWTRSRRPTAATRQSARRHLNLPALRPRPWASCWTSFADLMPSIRRCLHPQIVVQPAKRDRTDRCLGGPRMLPTLHHKRSDIRIAGTRLAPPPLPRSALRLNRGSLRRWPPCSWRTTGATRTPLARRVSAYSAPRAS